MSFTAREISLDELAGLPTDSIVLRMRKTAFGPIPMAKDVGGTWTVLGEWAEAQSVAYLSQPDDRFVLVWLGNNHKLQAWQAYIASPEPW